MTTWYQFNLCHLSYADHSSVYKHLKRVHHTTIEKFEPINDEKEIEDFRKSTADKRTKRRKDELNLLNMEKDSETIGKDSSVPLFKCDSLNQHPTDTFASIVSIILKTLHM